jgi:hypothetical protein
MVFVEGSRFMAAAQIELAHPFALARGRRVRCSALFRV